MPAPKLQRDKLRTKYYKKAMRYINNARAELKKSTIKNGRYLDDKHIRSACGTAYLGVLEAVNGILELKGITNVPFKHVALYRQEMEKIDGTLLDEFNDAYSLLHIAGYYRSAAIVIIIKTGFDTADQIIKRLKK